MPTNLHAPITSREAQQIAQQLGPIVRKAVAPFAPELQVIRRLNYERQARKQAEAQRRSKPVSVRPSAGEVDMAVRINFARIAGERVARQRSEGIETSFGKELMAVYAKHGLSLPITYGRTQSPAPKTPAQPASDGQRHRTLAHRARLYRASN